MFIQGLALRPSRSTVSQTQKSSWGQSFWNPSNPSVLPFQSWCPYPSNPVVLCFQSWCLTRSYYRAGTGVTSTRRPCDTIARSVSRRSPSFLKASFQDCCPPIYWHLCIPESPNLPFAFQESIPIGDQQASKVWGEWSLKHEHGPSWWWQWWRWLGHRHNPTLWSFIPRSSLYIIPYHNTDCAHVFQLLLKVCVYVCVFCCLFHLSFEGVDEEHVEEEVERKSKWPTERVWVSQSWILMPCRAATSRNTCAQTQL